MTIPISNINPSNLSPTPSKSISLPPPTIFTQDEILHAIPLPPLATFLTSLTLPEHLIKLNDILNRYRTPKSYHRIDVRVVESSELPPCSPSVGAGNGDEEGNDRNSGNNEEGIDEREKGNPVILPAGVSREEYLTRRKMEESARLGLGNGEDTNHSFTQSLLLSGNLEHDTQAQTSFDQILQNSLDGDPLPPLPSLSDISSLPVHQSSAEAGPSRTSVHNRAKDRAITLPPPATPLHPASPPPPLHPNPPSGPTRRIRELRLDLRTLDAAALFALETWRRQVLGLERLEMEHPDSIWYKAPGSPTPPPSSAKVGKSKTGRPRGRPRKNRVENEKNTLELGLDSTDEGAEKYQALMDALASSTDFNPEGQDLEGLTGDAEHLLADSTILKALDELIRTQQPATADPAPVPDQTEESDEIPSLAEPPVIAETDTVIQSDPDYSPSPDVILDDNFNDDKEDDPDFIPPQEPRKSISGRSRSRKRKGGKNTPSEETQEEIQEEVEEEIEEEIEEEVEEEIEQVEETSKKKPRRSRKSVTFSRKVDEKSGAETEESFLLSAAAAAVEKDYKMSTRKLRSTSLQSAEGSDGVEDDGKAARTRQRRSTGSVSTFQSDKQDLANNNARPDDDMAAIHSVPPPKLSTPRRKRGRNSGETFKGQPQINSSPEQQPQKRRRTILDSVEIPISRRSSSTFSGTRTNSASPRPVGVDVEAKGGRGKSNRGSRKKGSGGQVVSETAQAKQEKGNAKVSSDSEDMEEWGFLKDF